MASRNSDTLFNKKEDTYRQILAVHVKRYPRLEIHDLYKLVYQGAMASEHAVSDPTQTRSRLDREVENLIEGPVEPMIDPISEDGQILRVNLRPYVINGGSLSSLNEAFVRTANEHKGTVDELERYWTFAISMAQDSELGFQVKVLLDFFKEMRAQGFPAAHHSEAYKKAYKPAYRVVAHEFLVIGRS
ncbi:MAG: hypothetical protein E3J88_01355 [Anaerolineales bacterium]|nr:MAG: hypothetical protein E3J88_01355 [Anaerolineales bacterium]